MTFRHRSRTPQITTGISYATSHSLGSHSNSSKTFSDYVTKVSTDEMTDIETPLFHARSRRGEIIISPMRKRKVDASLQSNAGFSRTHGSSCVLTHSTLSYMLGNSAADMYPAKTPVFSLSGKDRVIAQASTQAHSNVASAEFETLIFLGELRQTLQLLRSPLGKIDDLLKKTQKKARRKGVSLARYLRDQWLSARYGWGPLLRDVDNVVKAVQSLQNRERIRHTARGHADLKDSVSHDKDLAAGSYTCAYQTFLEIEYSVRAGIIYEMDHRNTFGLSLSAVPSTAWELIPYSFVLDWFVNVGDYIQAIVPKPGVSILGSWHTHKEVWTSQATLSVKSYGSETIIDPGNAVGIATASTVTRVPGLPSPKLTPRFGVNDVDLGTVRIIDAIALITQRLK